jgi:hypothetical protein
LTNQTIRAGKGTFCQQSGFFEYYKKKLIAKELSRRDLMLVTVCKHRAAYGYSKYNNTSHAVAASFYPMLFAIYTLDNYIQSNVGDQPFISQSTVVLKKNLGEKQKYYNVSL